MTPPTGNLFASIPLPGPAEFFDPLWAAAGVTVERIMSRGHTTPPGEWLDQAWDEWVILLAGAARLRVEGRNEVMELGPNDWVLLPAGVRHRVEWTAPDQDTVWLSVHRRG